MRQANIVTTASAARALTAIFNDLPKADGETLVLVFLEDMKDRQGMSPIGFRAGYTPSIWPVGYASSDWAFGRLPDGRTFSLVPISGKEKEQRLLVDIQDDKLATFSIGPAA